MVQELGADPDDRKLARLMVQELGAAPPENRLA